MTELSQLIQPFARPEIIPRYLTDDFDVSVAVAVAKKARKLFESPTFAPIISVPAIDAVPDNSTDGEQQCSRLAKIA
jgi:hypothetical protein